MTHAQISHYVFPVFAITHRHRDSVSKKSSLQRRAEMWSDGANAKPEKTFELINITDSGAPEEYMYYE